MNCNTTYSKSVIYGIHNAIVINEEVKNELFRTIDLDEIITQYKLSNKHNHAQNSKNLINIMPFTDSCENPKCEEQKLSIEFSTPAHIIY